MFGDERSIYGYLRWGGLIASGTGTSKLLKLTIARRWETTVCCDECAPMESPSSREGKYECTDDADGGAHFFERQLA
jgi:hypothetical protein